MSYHLRLYPKAVEDYSEAYTWYEDKLKGLGERFINAVRVRLEDKVLNPESYGSK